MIDGCPFLKHLRKPLWSNITTVVIIAKVAYILDDYKNRKPLKKQKAKEIEESMEGPNLLPSSEEE